MIVSPVRGWLPPLVIALSAILGAVPAMADEPARLAPPTALRPASPEAPRAKPAASREKEAGLSRTEIEIEPLSAINIDSAGNLTEARGGLGAEMWRDSSRPLVETLLERLPVATGSPAMRDLMRRLLLSDAVAPRGQAKPGTFFSLRARLLAAMGDQAGVDGLLSILPGRAPDPALARIQAEGRFLGGDDRGGCEIAASQIGENDKTFWQKTYVFCQLLAGAREKAEFGLSLLRELGEEDGAFYILADAMAASKPATLKSLPNPAPLHLAMARVSGTKLPADALTATDPMVLRALALMPSVALEARLDAAERAMAAGILTTDAVRQLYEGIKFPEKDLASPFDRAEAVGGPYGRALLYAVSRNEEVATAKVEALADALALGRRDGRYLPTVRIFAPLLETIVPTQDMAWLAPEAVSTLLVAGRPRQATPWFNLLRAKAIFDKDHARMQEGLMPIARLAGAEEAKGWTAARLTAWWESAKDIEEAADRAVLLYTILGALGETVPQTLWEPLIARPEKAPAKDSGKTVAKAPPPSASMLQGLLYAAAGKRKGETALLSLIILGEGGPPASDTTVLGHLLRSLVTVGLERDARALGVEALAAAPL